jgi:histone H3/H4
MDSDHELSYSGKPHDDEPVIPKATLAKLISSILPKGVSMAKDAKDMIGEFSLEFVHLLSSEANIISEKQEKKMILSDHVIAALKSLGFDDFVSAVTEEVELFQKTSKETARKPFRLENSGLSTEELLKSQEELFARARERMNSVQSTPVSAVPPTIPTQIDRSSFSMPTAPIPVMIAQKKSKDQDQLFDSD